MKRGSYGYGAQNPLGDKRAPPGPKTKVETWGLGIWKLAREANHGRIWPKARGKRYGQRAMEHQRGPIGHNRYGVASWSQAKLLRHPWRRVITCGCDTLPPCFSITPLP
ncbi:hypothetical protein O181_043344 [Austropuccinia psidii MF-1]|uniref:Uncharacterized protein n=1 Tax=Austropuccinia psidii MF-1 TaxID=1389203 RepID=A0A9Q3DHU3_9BASI|nr:hypothetical protein [Austropuccinia psidii MF-1]